MSNDIISLCNLVIRCEIILKRSIEMKRILDRNNTDPVQNRTFRFKSTLTQHIQRGLMIRHYDAGLVLLEVLLAAQLPFEAQQRRDVMTEGAGQSGMR